MTKLVRGGTIVNHDHSRRADVFLRDGVIAAISANLEAPAGALNVYPQKCALVVGPDANLAIWDHAASKTISAKKQVSRIDYNVFEGFCCTGLRRATLLRGEITWLDGDLTQDRRRAMCAQHPPGPAMSPTHATWREHTMPIRAERADSHPLTEFSHAEPTN